MQKSPIISGAEAIIKCLIEEKVEVIFGYPGGAIMPVYDALYDYKDKIRHVLCRHEQGAIHAAQGYARISGKVGVCLVTSGPGAANLVTGLADAQIDSTPLVCITGQVASPFIGTDAFQETDVVGISTPITKWNVQVIKNETLIPALSKAFLIARSGRPGPTVVDITKDVQFKKMTYNYKPCVTVRSYSLVTSIDVSTVKQAASIINKAKKPYVVFGQGIFLANAKEEFRIFIEKGGFPSAWTIMGLSALSHDHPLNVGMLGMHGNYGANLLTNECDVLIAVGMRFDDRVTGDLTKYAINAKIIHLEIDDAEIDKNIKTDVAIHGDCKQSLPMLTDYIQPNSHHEWLKKFRECDKKEYEEVGKKELYPAKDKPISMGEVIRILSKQSQGQAVIVTDVGQHQMVAQHYYEFKTWRSNITSGGLGTMGFALPAAMGAKIGSPDREVIAVIGDGGFQMTIQELGTIFQDQIGVKILILNNDFLGMVRQWQELFFDKRYSFTEMVNPNFQMISKGYGIPSAIVNDRDNLESSIETFLNYDGCYLLEVVVGKENNVFPMVPSGMSVSDVRLK